MPPDKTSLSIRLTEPVVSLRNTPERASRHHEDETPPPAVVRGLLTLELAKPTRISSIEFELQAKAITHYAQGNVYSPPQLRGGSVVKRVTGAGPTRIDVTEQYKVHSVSTVVFKAGPVHQVRQRATSTKPRVQFLDDQTWSGAHGTHFSGLSNGRSVSLGPQPPRVRRPFSSDEMDNRKNSLQDQISSDSASPYFTSVGRPSFLGSDVYPSITDRSDSIASNSRITEPQSSPIQPRSILTPDICCGSSASSVHLARDLPLSRTSSIEELPEDGHECGDASSLGSGNVAYYGLSRIRTGSSSCSSEQGQRGRSHSRFSFGKVVHVFEAVKGRMRSQSPRAESRSRSEEQEERGRSLMKGKGNAQVSTRSMSHVLPQVGVTAPSVAGGANDQSGDSWVVFPEGIYTYPIFFTIPNDSPPTMKADRGSLTWKVKAEVKRPSAFKSNMTAQKEVIVVCIPKADELEVEGIDLQREWDGQFQYRVQIPGRGVPVGGNIPFQLTITPMMKIKVHCIMVYLDERTEYYTRAGSQVLSDAIRRATLLAIRHNNSDQRCSKPVLPLTSDEPDAFRKSPLHRFLKSGEEESEVASSFMGLGPWTIRHQLRVPNSCTVLHPSNRTKRSNIMVNHALKIVLRVEKEEGSAAAGRKKLYDIIIHTPIQILSCRCTSEWTSLPGYDEAVRSERESPEDTSVCPCRAVHQAKAQPDYHVNNLSVPLECVSSVFTTSSNPLDSVANRTRLHERLISGLVSERGETPPSYEAFEVIHV